MIEEIISDIIHYITEDIGYPVQLNENSNLADDAGMDSLDTVDLLGHLEAKYDVKFNEEYHSIFKKSIREIAKYTDSLRGNEA